MKSGRIDGETAFPNMVPALAGGLIDTKY